MHANCRRPRCDHIDSHIEAKCIELQTFRVRAVKYTHILCEFSSPDEKPKSEESKVTGTEAFVFTGCTY